MKANIKKINWLRIERGLSITELGSMTKLSKATISRMINENVNPRPETVGKIAKALNVSASELFQEDE